MMVVAFKARCSFKMVISRPREHLARGQFNSGRMIAPSRSYCPFIFLRLPLSIRPTTPPDPIRTRLCTPGATLRLPSTCFFFEGSLVRASAKGRFFHPSFYIFFPSSRFSDSFSPLKLFRWRLVLVSIDLHLQYTKLSNRY